VGLFVLTVSVLYKTIFCAVCVVVLNISLTGADDDNYNPYILKRLKVKFLK
jgi:hypothetical protein